MEDRHEDAIRSASTLHALRETADGNPELKEAMKNSIQPVQVCLDDLY